VFTTTSHSGSRENLWHLSSTNKIFSSQKRTRSLLKRALFSSMVLVAFFTLQMADAVAGTGTFQNGKFNFCVSIRFNATN